MNPVDEKQGASELKSNDPSFADTATWKPQKAAHDTALGLGAPRGERRDGARSPAPATWDYELLEEIARGGMARTAWFRWPSLGTRRAWPPQDNDKTIRLWTYAEQLLPELVLPTPAAPQTVRFAASDRQLLALLAGEHGVRVWRLDRLREFETGRKR